MWSSARLKFLHSKAQGGGEGLGRLGGEGVAYLCPAVFEILPQPGPRVEEWPVQVGIEWNLVTLAYNVKRLRWMESAKMAATLAAARA